MPPGTPDETGAFGSITRSVMSTVGCSILIPLVSKVVCPMVSPRIIPIVACALVLAVAAPARAQQSAQPAKKTVKEGRFLRVVRDQDKTPRALETAIVRFAPVDRGKKGPTVDLVAAVHVAERSYYRQLNREFAGYDVVLYELVAPEGTRVPQDGGDGDSPVSFLQKTMKNLLELEFQLDEIYYRRKNMVHADMSPEQFSKSMSDRGESMVGMFLRMMGYAIARQQGSDQPTDGQLLLALFDKNRALALKRIMAEQFQDMEGSLMAIDGPEGSTLISERNKVALKVLGEQLAAGKRKIAIFYGAGHMPDFESRLGEQFRLRPVGTRWLVAWNLKSEPKEQPAVPGAPKQP